MDAIFQATVTVLLGLVGIAIVLLASLLAVLFIFCIIMFVHFGTQLLLWKLHQGEEPRWHQSK